MLRIGIDMGGTFTDLVAVDERGKVTLAKSVSTPEDPSIAIIEGLRLLALDLGRDLHSLLLETDRIVHGTTVATNALLERKGARVAMLTTHGHRDVLEMREGLKDDRYNLRMTAPAPLVTRDLRIGVRERIRFDGSVETPLDTTSLQRAIRKVQRARVEAVAICYLHAYQNSEHEARTQHVLASQMPQVYVTSSGEVLPQIKEYERFYTTVVNAYVGPVLSHYLTTLAQRLQREGYAGEILVMQSHGGVSSLEDASQLAASAILSGPAGGIAGAQYAARLVTESNFITFDMGGTSTDIALLEAGEPHLSGEKALDGIKVALPSIDIHTLGAGGGSIARVDAGGILHVGPESAGAEPGPACYGKGGTEATVTDANVVLGYLDPKNFLGGRISLDADASCRAVERLSRQLGCSVVDAASGIHTIVNTNMAEGIRIVSVRRGIDPRRFILLAFGGAAGLHISGVSRMLEINRVIVPRVAAVLSAWGMLSTDLRSEFVRTHVGNVRELGVGTIREIFAAMEAKGREQLTKTFSGTVAVRRSADMRYGEQIFEISVPLESVDLWAPDLVDRMVERFQRRHEELYTYSAPDQEIVFVNARLSITGELPSMPVEPVLTAKTIASSRLRRVFLGGWIDAPVYDWDTLSPGLEISGPAVVESATTTVLAAEGDHIQVTPHGWLDVRLV